VGDGFMKLLKNMIRVYVANLNEAIVFYEQLVGIKSQQRFVYAKAGLELASVGDFLLICGSEEVLKKFRETHTTLLVDSLAEYKEFLEGKGAIILEQPKEVPTGWNMRVKHADGLIVEYVEHTT
jgi:predicted enzyme related to lactoylglutathione lyase